MNKSYFIFAMALALTASAQESAELVQTSGSGELNRASEAMIAQSGQTISVRLPVTVRKGEIIAIQYAGAGNSVADSFMVTGISIKDGACALESMRDTKAGAALSDVIRTRPCKKLR